MTEDRIGLLLLAPDAFLACREARILRLVQDAGLTVVSSTYVQLTREGMERVYATTVHDPRRWPDRTMRQLWGAIEGIYALAPGAVVLVKGEIPVTKTLTALKGDKRPELTVSGTIRSDVDAESVMLNLVHTSDGPDDVRREAAVLLGEDRAAAQLAACLEPAESRLRRVLATATDEPIPGRAGRRSVSTPWVLNAVRTRAVRLWACSSGADLDAALNALASLQEERHALGKATDTITRLRVARSNTADIEKALRRAGRHAAEAADPVHRLAALLRLKSGTDDVAAWIDAVRCSGVYLHAIEEHLLVQHARAFRSGSNLDPIWSADDPPPLPN